MKISLVTPAGKQSRSGNRTTAVRWAQMLRGFGHRVAVAETDPVCDADMMVAVHAWRSADSIRRFNEAHPDRPLVVLLAGTDIYRFQYSHPAATLESMDRASALVCLHELAYRAVPKRFRAKLRLIRQSAPPLGRPREPSRGFFEVCVIGHLRAEKDPLRAALAARRVPAGSKLRVVQIGKAHNQGWARQACAEMARNPRYQWRGEVPGWQVRRLLARSHAMVISSIVEGGANVVSEAVAAGVPVIASRIDGNVGLLGPDYAGYFPAKDTGALAKLLWRAESDPWFLKRLAEQSRRLRPLFSPYAERNAWRDLLRDLGFKPVRHGS
jgi:putative glycosyltransferase (TIGR04348 family)